MRIAFCLEYPLATCGGASVLVNTLTRELRGRGCEIVLVSPDAEGTLLDAGADGGIQRHISFDSARIFRPAAKCLAFQTTEAGVGLAHFHLGGQMHGRNAGHAQPAHD